MKTPQSTRATEIRKATSEGMAAIRADKLLSDHGRRTKITDLYASAKAQLKALQAEERAELSTARSGLEDKLFGTSGTRTGVERITYRDAEDRADQAKNPDQASAMLRRALANHDDELATAIARRAADREWGDVFTHWCNARRSTLSDIDDVVDQLAAIDDHFESRDATDVLAYALPQPHEAKDSLGSGQEPGKRPLNRYDAQTPGFDSFNSGYAST